MEQHFDASWRHRAIAGDPQAIQALANHALEPLYNFCFCRVGFRRDVCEDVVQETLLVAIRRLDRYDPERPRGNIFGWLTGLARNEIRRALARERSAVSLEELWARMDQELIRIYERLEAETFGDDVLERAETREMVNATMSHLPPDYREALEAKYVLGKSVREIAEAVNTTEKAVESQLARARKAFRQTFLALMRNFSIRPIS